MQNQIHVAKKYATSILDIILPLVSYISSFTRRVTHLYRMSKPISDFMQPLYHDFNRLPARK